MKELLISLLPVFTVPLLFIVWLVVGIYVKKTTTKKDDKLYYELIPKALQAFLSVEKTGILANKKINKLHLGIEKFNALNNKYATNKEIKIISTIFSVLARELKNNKEVTDKLKSELLTSLKKTKK